jgi:Ergosterol biosynthesis ERG4/ERG24 family
VIVPKPHISLAVPYQVRIPWVLLFLIALGGAAKQYEQYGYVSAEQGFMILATGLYINACVLSTVLRDFPMHVSHEE